jgi:5-methyltetrahydrofolate--homocysteine methyltransferase
MGVPQDGMLDRIVGAFTSGCFEEINQLVLEGLDRGMGPDELLDGGLIRGIREVGEQFRRSEVYLPEMMMAADAWQEGADLLRPLLSAGQAVVEPVGRVVLGTVKGDIHSLGKNIVATMLRAVGFEVHDLGIDVAASRFVEEAGRLSADIVALSALMTTTMPYQADVIEHLRARRRRDRYFVLVGGGPTSPEWAQSIGADAHGKTAADAVRLALAYMQHRCADAVDSVA